MTETPRKTLTLKRKPPTEAATDGETETKEVKRLGLGKRIIRREELVPAKPVRNKPTGGPRKPTGKPGPQQTTEPSGPSPSELMAKALDQLLCGEHTAWAEFKPLAHGIEAELYAYMAEKQPPASKRIIQRLLRMHCNHGKYLQSILDNTTRFTLQGEASGEILPSEHEHATRTLENYGQKKQQRQQ